MYRLGAAILQLKRSQNNLQMYWLEAAMMTDEEITFAQLVRKAGSCCCCWRNVTAKLAL